MADTSARRTAVTGSVVTALACLAAFGLLTILVVVQWDPLVGADRAISTALRQVALDQPGLLAAMRVVTDAGRPLIWWIVHTVVAVFLLTRRHVRAALFVAVTAGIGGLLSRVIKELVVRDRPEWTEPLAQASGFAFPSGHTTGTAIGVGVLLIVFLPLVAERWRWVVVTAGAVFTLAVGLSRVVLGVHWTSDVLGGLLFSAAWTLAMAAAFRPGLSSRAVSRATDP